MTRYFVTLIIILFSLSAPSVLALPTDVYQFTGYEIEYDVYNPKLIIDTDHGTITPIAMDNSRFSEYMMAYVMKYDNSSTNKRVSYYDVSKEVTTGVNKTFHTYHFRLCSALRWNVHSIEIGKSDDGYIMINLNIVKDRNSWAQCFESESDLNSHTFILENGANSVKVAKFEYIFGSMCERITPKVGDVGIIVTTDGIDFDANYSVELDVPGTPVLGDF